MGPERRLAATQAFWASAEQKDAHRQLEALLAQRLKARPVFIRRLPPERKAAYLAQDAAPNPLLFDSVMLAYHFAGQRQMLVDFLDALGIPHKDGHYETSEASAAPSEEQLEKAVAGLLEKYPKPDVLVYLAAVALQDQAFWAKLLPIVERMEKEVAAEANAKGAG